MTKNICILAGARPNFIKVSPLVREIKRRQEAGVGSQDVSCLLVYAGSADDPTLEPSLFDDLQMDRPQYYLGVESTSLNEITSKDKKEISMTAICAFCMFLSGNVRKSVCSNKEIRLS